MMVNIAYALLSALKVAVKETRSAPGSLKGSAVEKVMQDLLHVSFKTTCQCYHLQTDHRSCLSSSLIPIFAILPARHWAGCVIVQEML